MGDKEHSHNSNCIYSIVNLTGTLLSSLCQMLIKSSWLYSGSGVSLYHKWSLTICDGCFDTLKSSKMWS